MVPPESLSPDSAVASPVAGNPAGGAACWRNASAVPSVAVPGGTAETLLVGSLVCVAQLAQAPKGFTVQIWGNSRITRKGISLVLPMQGAGIQSLIRKSRSHMPPGPAPPSPKKKERKKEKITRKGRSRNRQKNQYNTVKFKNKIKYIKKKRFGKKQPKFSCSYLWVMHLDVSLIFF